MAAERNTFWLSFADEDTGKNLGGCFVRAYTLQEAIQAAWDAGCNPGGEVLGLGPGPEQDRLPYDTLLQAEDMADNDIMRGTPEELNQMITDIQEKRA